MRDPCDSRSTEAQDLGGADPEPPERLHLDIVYYDGNWRPFKPTAPAVEAAGRALTDVLSMPAAVAAVALSSDKHVRALNRAYRGKDEPTNVLSFPALPARGGAGGRFLGDIVLAAETVAREAAEQGKPLRHHLQHLVVHGLMHLYGFDHRSAAEAEEMEALEAKILARLGITNPYTELVASTINCKKSLSCEKL
ncbi:MAG TPA: rRNA maturation RNase YbeY [Hyphomicrobiaceae bacterium]|nr:rRNA maturation RNase YbeY [Hyphomicrobiaceae bacterium]